MGVDISSKYIKAVRANFVTWGVSTLFFLIVTPIAIKVMGAELYGLWAIINAILLLSSVGTLGMSQVVSKFGAEKGERALQSDVVITVGFILMIAMAALVGGLILSIRGWLSEHIVREPSLQTQMKTALSFTALSLFPQFISRIPQGYLFSQLRFDLAKTADTISIIALWSGAVLIARASPNLAWMAVWGFIVQVGSMGLYLYFVLRERGFRWRWDLSALRSIGRFSAFTFIQSIAVSLYQNFDRILVGYILGPAAAGAYSIGTSVGLRLSIVTGQVTEVLVPYASRKQSLEDKDALCVTFRRVSALVNVAMMFLGGILVLWMEIILRIWISPEFADANADIFRVLIVAYMLISASRPGNQILYGMGRVRSAALIYLASTLVMLLSLALAASKWGTIGAAAANLCMVLLLSYDVLVLKLLGEKHIGRHLVSNMTILLVIPAGAYYLANMIGNGLVVRLIASFLLGLASLIIMWMDRDLRGMINLLCTNSLRIEKKYAVLCRNGTETNRPLT